MDSIKNADYIMNEQDALTDLLKKIHLEYGVNDVKWFLRLALVNYTAEVSDTEMPNDDLIEEIANAIKRPQLLK